MLWVCLKVEEPRLAQNWSAFGFCSIFLLVGLSVSPWIGSWLPPFHLEFGIFYRFFALLCFQGLCVWVNAHVSNDDFEQMTPVSKYYSGSRVMEASGQVKMESVVVAAHLGLKEGGRLVKRKSARSEFEQCEKESNSSSLAPAKIKCSAKEDGASVNGKRKRLIKEADLEMDSEHVMNAAQALFELFGGAGASSQKGDKSCDTISFKPATAGSSVKWAAKKCRSGRSSRKVDDCACKMSTSSTTSATMTDIPEVLDSSASHNHHAVAAFPPEAVQLHDDSEADVDAKSTDMSPCGIGLDRGYRLLSQSSVESTLLDSRAESPSSPLHVLKHSDVAQIPMLEEELLLQFGFQNQPPLRSVTKPLLLRKPKAEEYSVCQLDEVREVKTALKQVQRRKPRVSNLKGQPLLLQGDVLDVPISTSENVLKECIEENKFQVPVTLNLFERVKLEVEKVNVESREPYRTGSSTQGRLRTALSEVEKEARRLRRVQANRESARQTIRRKQVLCEELARKAGELQAEKDNLSLSVEVKSKELRDYQDINRQLKEKILTQSEAPLASISRASNNFAPSLVSPTASRAQEMQMMPYWWAFALAQSVAATSESTSAAAPPRMGEAGAVAAASPPDFNTVIAATVAAFSREAGSDANVWMSMVGNMSINRSFLPEMALPVALKRATGLARAAADERPPPHQLLGRTISMPVSGHSYPTSSSMNDNPKGTTVKYQLTNGAQLMRSISHSYAAVASTSTTLSLGLGSHPRQQQMRKPANLRFFPTIGNGVQGYLGPRLGVYQTEAAALATEARRRRRELKRTKSSQSQLEQEKKLASVRTL